jgi:polysaccharide chain length determinant protein (PEP-CTERM system associated)
MKELVEEVLAEIQSAWRFRWFGMTLMWVVSIGGWAWVILQPNVFEATARVYVDTSSVLEPVLGNQIVTPDVEAQIAYVREALLGRPRLEAVARETGLDARAATPQQRETVLASLAAAIQLDSQGGTRNTPDNLYDITYRNTDRDVAVSVVDEILETFVESAHGASRLQGDTAEQFLDERVQEYETRLAQADQALADFKRANADKLPGAEGDYFQRLQTERDALAGAQRQLRILQSRRDQLSEQLRGERSVVPGVTDVATEPPPNSIDARIRDYETQLDAALLQYTEKHPTVIALRDALDRLLAQRSEQLASLGIAGSDQELQALAANPIYESLQVAIAETDVEMATLRADVNEREARVAELQALIGEVPQVEAQLTRLNRDYDVVYQQYLALVRSRETQELTRKASDTDQVDFRIINPPLASFTPVAPNRLLLLAAVFGAALAAGAGLCYVLAQLSPVFSNSSTLARQVGLPVFGVIMNAWAEQQLARHRAAIGLFAGAFAALVLCFAGLMGIEMFGSGLHELVS